MPDQDWKKDFRFDVEDFIDRYVVKGARPEHVLDALIATVETIRRDGDRDSDPADDPAVRDPEPSNDWPGADKD
ncbi:hypothetical protein [Xylophilus sp.]|uniref:hypothetical protein n=1 Tax=Xylophilus sp. TaxID=2653893 RepID=UPI002D7F12A0|nr:hypothetical protein [Xylophilus sp.]